MPLIDYPNFVGPTYSGQSIAVDAERCINLVPEVVGPPEKGKSRIYYFGTPGLPVYCTLPKTVIYAMTTGAWVAASASWFKFVLAGDAGQIPHLYEIQNSGAVTVVDRGQLTGAFVTVPNLYGMVWNGLQLFIYGYASPGVPSEDSTHHAAAWYWNAEDLSMHHLVILTTQMAPVAACLLDGYTVVVSGAAISAGGGTVSAYSQLNTSAYRNNASWDALAFATIDDEPDVLIGIGQDHAQAFVFGTTRTTPWYDAGATPFPLAKQIGVMMEVGVIHQDTIVQVDNSLTFIGRDPRGQLIAYRQNGYVPQRISTHDIEWRWQQYKQPSSVNAYAMQFSGHTWYVLSFTADDATWVYDLASGMWFEWLSWDSGSGFHASPARYHMFDQSKALHLVGGGDGTGNIYSVDVNSLLENGKPIKRLRATPHLSDKEVRLFISSFQLDMQVGNASSLLDGDGNPIPPYVMLRVSKDGGFTWSNELQLSCGQLGEYFTRVRQNRLGSGRNWVFELSMTDPIPAVWINAYLDVQEGSS